MSNARFLWENRHLDAATLTSLSAATGYPVTCLQDVMRTRKWRSTGITEEYVGVAFDATKYINAIALIDHNLTFAAQVEIKAGHSVGIGDILTTTKDVWRQVIGYGEGGYGLYGYGGFIPEAERAYEIPRAISIIYLDETIEASRLQLTFIDDGNADGYIEVGRLFAGFYMDFEFNFSEITHGAIEETELSYSAGGQAWGDSKPQRETISLSFQNTITHMDKYWKLKRMIRKNGLSNSFLIDCFPGGGSENFYSTLYGRFQELPELSKSAEGPFYGGLYLNSTDLTFEESL